MRPLIFPLVFLLLALCRSTSSEPIFWGYTEMYTSTSSVSIAPEKAEEQIDTFILGNNPRRMAYLHFQLGNTIYAMIWNRLGLYDSLPSYYKDALDNGVLCEVNDELSEESIRDIQYNSMVLSIEQRAKEVEAAKNLAIGIDCDSSSPDPCFCIEKKVLLYCAALKFKAKIEKAGVVKKTCEKELLVPLEAAFEARQPIPEMVLFPIYHDDHHHEMFVKDFINGTVDNREDFICSITNPRAETAVKTLFAANALRWTLEGYIMNAVLGPAYKDLEDACESESFKSSEAGQCACSKDKGIAFCIYKVRAEYYQRLGYMTCENGSYKSHEDKKPAKLPPFQCLIDSVAAESTECTSFHFDKQLSTAETLH